MFEEIMTEQWKVLGLARCFCATCVASQPDSCYTSYEHFCTKSGSLTLKMGWTLLSSFCQLNPRKHSTSLILAP